jgi:hypothetical protein
MNSQPRELDPAEELTRLGDPAQELYGLSQRLFFYAIKTCYTVESFATPAFTIEPIFAPPGLTPSGAWVEFVIKSHVFWIDAGLERARLWTALADDSDAIHHRYLVWDRAADDPKAWEGLLVEIGRVEEFGVYVNLADTLRHEWSMWRLEQQRRDDERGILSISHSHASQEALGWQFPKAALWQYGLRDCKCLGLNLGS